MACKVASRIAFQTEQRKKVDLVSAENLVGNPDTQVPR